MKNKIKQLEFFTNYFELVKNTIEYIDIKKIIQISDFLEKAIINKKKIFVAGNGGSAAVANHFLCDFNKGIKISSKNKMIPKVYSLSNSIELITAISNDINYENIFDFQLENHAEKGDILFAMSCSGNSKNINKVISYAIKKKMKVIFFTGFSNKNFNKKISFHYNINCKNYGITEDIFSSFMHLISQWIRFKYSNYNSNNIL